MSPYAPRLIVPAAPARSHGAGAMGSGAADATRPGRRATSRTHATSATAQTGKTTPAYSQTGAWRAPTESTAE